MVNRKIEGNYSSEVLGFFARDVVFNHDVALPLFLMLSFQAVHSPMQVPQVRRGEGVGGGIYEQLSSFNHHSIHLPRLQMTLQLVK